MTATLLDYAAPKGPEMAKEHGAVGVMRYISNGDPKDITGAECTSLHDAGLVIGLVWETTRTRARDGKDAGHNDYVDASNQATNLGYPAECPIFFAVDEEVPYGDVAAYFDGVAEAHSVGKYKLTGPYGSKTIVDGFAKSHPHGVAWQTSAWSNRKRARSALLYQHTYGKGYDVSDVRKPIQLWAKSGPVTVTKDGVVRPPAPKPPVKKKATRLSPISSVLVNRLEHRLKTRLKADKHPLALEDVTRIHELSSLAAEAEVIH